MARSIGIPPALLAIAVDGKLTARQRRHFLLERLLLRGSAGSGTADETLRRRTARHSWPDLRPLLEGIPWAVVGDVATRAYMPERATQGMDVIVRRADGPLTVRRLVDAGYLVESDLAIPGKVIRSPDGIELDMSPITTTIATSRRPRPPLRW